MISLRGLAVAAACLACLWGGTASAQPLVRALSPDDTRLYAEAFHAAARGDFDAAVAIEGQVTDKCLLGYIEFQRLMRPGVENTYDEFKAWLDRYADQPPAARIAAIAMRRKPADAPLPRLPADFEAAAPLIPPASSTPGQAAREAYYSGDINSAYPLAVASGERWVAALAAYRLKKFDDALDRFRQVASDPSENDWLRAAAGFWAAKTAGMAGHPEMSRGFLVGAARYPTTFYGIIAERKLGIAPGADPKRQALEQAGMIDPLPPEPEVVKAANVGVPVPLMARLVNSDDHARRAVALMQVGLRSDAAQEVKAGIASARSESERAVWTSLAVEMNARGASARAFDTSDYPTPPLAPKGGFTITRAMVYAMIRQESKFNPNITSYAGAIGLMQLVPATAARASGDDNLKRNPSLLRDPAINMRAGQDYFDMMLGRAARGDLIRAIAAYNGGPGQVYRAEQTTRGGDDPFLLIESFPSPQTRDYVEKVLAGYWIYRRMFGEDTRTLDALANGAKMVDARLDR